MYRMPSEKIIKNLLARHNEFRKFIPARLENSGSYSKGKNRKTQTGSV